MREIESLNEMRQISLNALILFHKFCQENNLKYSLAAGTMIGAVRHKGFIPWDDDIDLYMERGEYNRLIQLVKKGITLRDDEYEIIIPETAGYIYPFIKIVSCKTIVYERDINPEYAVGIWIDIFPIDNCGNSLKEANNVIEDMRKTSIMLMRTVALYQENSLINMFKNVYLWCIKNVLRKKYIKYKEKKLSYEFPIDSKYKGNLIWTFLTGEKFCDVYPAEYFEDYTTIEFEGYEFMIFTHYDQILRKRYGNYMQLPKKEERVGHKFKAYYVD